MPHRYVWKQTRDFLVYRVLHADDTPHRIALGVAVGVFVAFTPTIGFQMVLAVALAWLIGGNKVVAVPFVWISNPFTMVPIYLPNYYVGRWLLGSSVPPPDFGQVVQASGTWLEKVRMWWDVTWQSFTPLWVGSLVVAFVLAIPSYFVFYWMVVLYRKALAKVKHAHAEENATGAPESSPASPPESR